MEAKIKWNEGDGNITVTYEGSGNGAVVISSDVNEGVDREQSLTVETTKGNEPKRTGVTVRQMGMREVYNCMDGEYICKDGKTFNVLKNGVQR